MGEHGNRIFGAAIVLIGLLMLMGELVSPALRLIWPIALAVAGAAVLVQYRRHHDDSGKVFTGTTLLLIGLFLLAIVEDWLSIKGHWPFFIAAPGIGLLAMARVDPRRRDAMVPGWMAIGAAAVLYFFTLGLFVDLLEIVFDLLALVLKVLVPLGLIGLGAWMLFHQNQQRQKAEGVPEKVEPKPAGWGPDDTAETAGAADAASEDGAAADDDAEEAEPFDEPLVTPRASAAGPEPPVEDADVEELGDPRSPVDEPGEPRPVDEPGEPTPVEPPEDAPGERPPVDDPDPDRREGPHDAPVDDPEHDPARRQD